MYYIYNLLLIVLLLILSPVWLLILISGKKFRAGFAQKIGFLPQDIVSAIKSFSKRPVWFHAVSVGETLAVQGLVKDFKKKNPDLPVVFSTVTFTGQQIAKQRLGDLATVIYFPFDIGFVTNKIINLVDPQVVIVVETEIWPNFSYNVSAKNIPLVLINGRISPKSFKNYVIFKFFISKILGMYTCFLMQSDLDAGRIVEMGAKKQKVRTTGNIKYDIKPNLTDDQIANLKQELNILAEDKLLIAGSTHDTEEKIILDVYLKLKEELESLKLVLVPRHPERYQDVFSLLKEYKLDFAKRSQHETFEKASVFVLDTMGELLSFYSVSDIAFIGGTMIPKGGHNPLEPAAFSVPVVLGPHTFNFVDITKYMTEAGVAIQVNDENALYDSIRTLLVDSTAYNKAKVAAADVLDANRGATQETINVINGLLVSE